MSAVVLHSVGVAVVLALPLVWRVLQRRFDPFEPIVVFALAWGVMFVVRPLAIVVRDDTDFYGLDIGSTLDEAVLLGLAGAVAFVVGHELSLGRRLATRLPSPPAEVATRPVLLGASLVTAAGIVALGLVLLPNGGLSALGTFLGGRSGELDEIIASSTVYLWYGSLVVVSGALAAMAIAVATRHPAAIATALVLGVVALVRTVPTGNRVFLVVLVGATIVLVYVRASRRPGLLALGVGLVLALFLSRAILEVRDPETREDIPTLLRTIAASPSRAFSPLYRGADAEMAPALAGALTVVPSELGHRFGGAMLGDLLVRPVPRKLWPGKPEPPGEEVAATVWPVARETGGFDPAFTPLLVLYWDFGLVGAFAGLALLGIAARTLLEYFRAHHDRLVAQLLYATGLCFLVVALRHDPVTTLVWALILFAPVLLVFQASGRERWAGADEPARP